MLTCALWTSRSLRGGQARHPLRPDQSVLGPARPTSWPRRQTTAASKAAVRLAARGAMRWTPSNDRMIQIRVWWLWLGVWVFVVSVVVVDGVVGV